MDIIGKAMVPLRKIAKRGIPIFIAPGNHEREYIPGGLLLAGENIHVFSKPETFEFSVKDESVVIVGFPFIRYEPRTEFAKQLRKTGWKQRRDAFNILLCHQTFEGARVGKRNFTFRNGENIVPLSEIPSGFKYIACGHIHKQQEIKRKEGNVYYAGSTERVSFQEMEEEKGFLVVNVKEGVPYPRFHKLPVTIMAIIELDTTGKESGELADFIEERINSAKPFSILRFYLEGAIELEKLKNIPLYLYKKRRNDVKIEFRKEKLIILKERKKRIYVEEPVKKERRDYVPTSIQVDDFKERFLFTKKGVDGVPALPGIYMLMNRDDRVFYIGKAKSLKSRLVSHLRRIEKGNEGFYFWLKQVKKIDIVTTSDELSGLFLEMSLIRSNLPPYNKQIQEFQNYVYLTIREDICFPTIKVVDEVKDDGNHYFGPFRKEYKIKENIKLIRELFGIRPCRRNLDDSLRLFSCVKEEIGLCDAPCTGGVNPSIYKERVNKMIDFLNGYDNRYIKKLQKVKGNLLGIEEFEKAAVLQRKITNLTIIFSSLKSIREMSETNGILSINLGKEKKEVFEVMNGRILWGREKGSKRLEGSFPPKKWELDEMMLLLRAVRSRDKCFSIIKERNTEKKKKGSHQFEKKRTAELRKS
jgi:DNA repair exonuclease SbcCD nuclease subunit